MVAGRIPTPAETVVTLPETTTGGTWSLTVTTASGASTTASGIAYNADPATLKAALDGLANLTALGADVEVSIETTSPRAYRIKWEGTDLSGTEVTATASGAGLLGNASAEIAIVQRPGAETPAVWQVYAIDDGEGGQDVTVVVDGVEYSATAEQIASESYWNSKFAGGVSGFQSAAIPEPGTARNGYVAAFSVLSDEALSVSPDYFGGYAAAQAGFQQLQEFEDEAGASEWVFFGDGGGETRRYTIGGNETGDVTANTSISAAIEALAQFESGDTEEAPFRSPSSLIARLNCRLSWGSPAGMPQTRT